MMLDALYGDRRARTWQRVVARDGRALRRADAERVCGDLVSLLSAAAALAQGRRLRGADAVRTMPFGSHKRELPVLSEIALTYRCQNRCTFCYADAPRRGRRCPR